MQLLSLLSITLLPNLAFATANPAAGSFVLIPTDIVALSERDPGGPAFVTTTTTSGTYALSTTTASSSPSLFCPAAAEEGSSGKKEQEVFCGGDDDGEEGRRVVKRQRGVEAFKGNESGGDGDGDGGKGSSKHEGRDSAGAARPGIFLGEGKVLGVMVVGLLVVPAALVMGL